MKIPPKPAKLDALDLSPYTPGRPGKTSSHQPFKLDLDALRAGPEKGPLGPLDLSPFKAGGATGPAALLPLDLSAMGSQQAAPAGSQHQQLTEQAQKWVAQTFFGTLMKQMSDSPFKSDLFSGGRGGEAFSSLYHQQLVDRMASAAGSKLVNGIVRQIESNKRAQQEKGFKVEGAEQKTSARPTSDHDPRTKAYNRSRPSQGRQSSFNLAG